MIECREYMDGWGIYENDKLITDAHNCETAWSNYRFELAFQNAPQPIVCGIENPETCESCQ